MKTLITLLVAGIFTSNLITSNLLGAEVLEKGRDKTLLDVLKRGLVTVALLVGFTAVTYPLGKWVIEPLGLGFLSALIYILIILGSLFGICLATDKFIPCLKNYLDAEAVLPVVLAVCLLNMSSELVTSYGIALLYALICSAGYILVSVIVFAVCERLSTAELPSAVKGLPIILIILSLISLAFGGFAGI